MNALGITKKTQLSRISPSALSSDNPTCIRPSPSSSKTAKPPPSWPKYWQRYRSERQQSRYCASLAYTGARHPCTDSGSARCHSVRSQAPARYRESPLRLPLGYQSVVPPWCCAGLNGVVAEVDPRTCAQESRGIHPCQIPVQFYNLFENDLLVWCIIGRSVNSKAICDIQTKQKYYLGI